MTIAKRFYRQNDEQNILEVCLVLFSRCNLNCQFCFQTRLTDIDIQYIHDIPEKIRSSLVQFIEQRKYTQITYRVWGGELFADELSDEIFVEYQHLKKKLVQLGNEFGITSKFCFTSNYVFTVRQRVKDLLDTNTVLATSYDPMYRFQTTEQKEQWFQNINVFQPESISLTLTKQNIQSYLNDPDHLEQLRQYHVNLEYYIYNHRYQFFRPSEDDLYQFLRYCIDKNYQNIDEVAAIVKSFQNPLGRYCTCNNSCLYLNGSLTFNCLKRSSDLHQSEFFDELPSEENYTEMQAQTALTRKKCLNCKNFSFCRMYCLASVLHKSYSSENCGLARIYDYIEQEGIKW